MCYTISMNNKEYLEQISADSRKKAGSAGGFFGFNISPRLGKIIIGAFIAAVLIIVIGGIASIAGGSSSERDYLDRIYLRANNLMTAMSTYNKKVKSSSLRSMGNSLNAVLSETSYNVSTILKENYEATPGKPAKEKILKEEEQDLTDLTDSLENARISGTLDRVYAHNFTYAIDMLLNLESEAINKAKKQNTIDALTTSRTNLDQLYTQFDNFAIQ